MPLLKPRQVEPDCLIDLNSVPVLWPMRAGDDSDWRLCRRGRRMRGRRRFWPAPSWTTPSARGRARWPPAKSHSKLHLLVPQRLEVRLTLGAPVTIRFSPLPQQLGTLFSEASETALVCFFTADNAPSAVCSLILCAWGLAQPSCTREKQPDNLIIISRRRKRNSYVIAS